MQEQVLNHEEIEWQLEAVELALVENWLQEHPSAAGLALVPGPARELADVHYDTEDWRFYRAGYALRVRRDGESTQATMKALAPAEDGLRRRCEISEPLEGLVTLKGIAGPVGERLRRLAGTADLRPLFEVHTRRRIFALVPKHRPQGRSWRTLRETSADRTRSKMPPSPRSHSTSRRSSLTAGRGPT